MSVKIVHCADIHIGTTFSHLPSALASLRAEELRNSFLEIINYCKEKSVDALIICGDLFDCPNPVEKDCEFVKNAFLSLSPVPVYIVCGNHDYMCQDSPFSRENYFSDNVHIFPCFDYSFDLTDKNTVFYGKSYNSSITDPTFTNIDIDENKINIFCLHGDITPSSDYNIISKDTLLALPCNYAAFGHIHNGEIFDVNGIKCAYSGTPEGHKFNDDGFTGFIYAEIDNEKAEIFPVSLSKRRYRNISYNITGDDHNQTVSSLKKLLNKDDLYKISLIGEYSQPVDIASIKEELSGCAFFIDITDNSSPAYDFDAIEKEESLRGEFLRELRKLSKSEEEFILCGKTGLDALSGRIPSVEVEI